MTDCLTFKWSRSHFKITNLLPVQHWVSSSNDLSKCWFIYLEWTTPPSTSTKKTSKQSFIWHITPVQLDSCCFPRGSVPALLCVLRAWVKDVQKSCFSRSPTCAKNAESAFNDLDCLPTPTSGLVEQVVPTVWSKGSTMRKTEVKNFVVHPGGWRNLAHTYE